MSRNSTRPPLESVPMMWPKILYTTTEACCWVTPDSSLKRMTISRLVSFKVPFPEDIAQRGSQSFLDLGYAARASRKERRMGAGTASSPNCFTAFGRIGVTLAFFRFATFFLSIPKSGNQKARCQYRCRSLLGLEFRDEPLARVRLSEIVLNRLTVGHEAG